jgi:hypothetical protein
MEAVYILKDLSKDGTYKFGRSKNIHQRVGQLQTGSSGELEYKAFIFCKSASLLETRIHDKLKNKNIHGEWFKLTDTEFNQAYMDLKQMRDEINNIKKTVIKTTKTKITETIDTETETEVTHLETNDTEINDTEINDTDTIDIKAKTVNIDTINDNIYKCDTCPFKSEYQSNYLRHTKICNKDVPAKFSCKYCSAPYKTAGTLNNHRRKCNQRDKYEHDLEIENKTTINKLVSEHKITINKIVLEHNTVINNLKLEYNILLQNNIELKTEIVDLKNQLHDDKKDFKEIAKNASIKIITNTNTNISESAFKYITSKFSDAPVLEKKEVQKLQKYNNSNEAIQNKLVEEWLCLEKSGSLMQSIGNIIIDLYKTDDPTLQSFWASDIERLTFYRRALNDRKVAVWITDKKGIDILALIIKPILDQILDQIIAYNDKYLEMEGVNEEYIDLSYKVIEKLNETEFSISILKY